MGGADGQFRPPNGRDFRRGAAVHVRHGIPLSDVQQPGHAWIDTTSIYANLDIPERRAMAD